MFNNRIVHLVYRTFFLTFTLIAIIDSVYGFNTGYYDKFFIFKFDHISYYLIFAFSLSYFIYTFRLVILGRIKGGLKIFSGLTFLMCVTSFISTFCFWCITYPKEIYPKFPLTVSAFYFYFLCPLLLLIDYLIFQRHFSINFYHFIAAIILPLSYIIALLLLMLIFPSFKNPYFFLDPRIIGYGKVFMWISIIFCFILVLCFLLYLWDRTYFNKNKKFRIDLKHEHKMYEYKEV